MLRLRNTVPGDEPVGERVKRYDEWRSCPKCGNGKLGIGTKYIDGAVTGNPMIRRECARCGYKWNERPLDAPAASDPLGRV